MDRAGTLILLLALPLVAGCVDQRASIDFEDGCIETAAAQSTPGSFQYGGTACSKDGMETHAWENVAPVANVQWGGSVASGSLAITILDSAGREVYTAALDATAEGAQGSSDPGFPSVPGVASWTIQIAFQDFYGTMGLEVTSG